MRMEGFKKISDDLERVIEKDDSNSSTTTESEDGKQVMKIIVPFKHLYRYHYHWV